MTLILKIDPLKPDLEKIKIAAKAIIEGKLVVFPTETVYGLGADALNPLAVKKIFIAKNRPPDNPLIVHICKKDQLYELVEYVPKWVEKAIDILWPGPVTFVLKKKEIVPDVVTAKLDTVAIRMPAHPIALKLIELSKPIAAPSANLSGKPSPTRPEDVYEDMLGRADIIIDGGETFFGVESTVIDATEDIPIILRPGPMTPEELSSHLGINVQVHPSVLKKGIVKKAKSPGMKYRHYSPNAKLILVEGTYTEIIREIRSLYEEYSKMFKVALLLTEESSKILGIPKDIIIIGSRGNLYTVAKNLFSSLRELDRRGYDIGIIEGFELRGIGLAIMNRLRKAASEIIKK